MPTEAPATPTPGSSTGSSADVPVTSNPVPEAQPTWNPNTDPPTLPSGGGSSTGSSVSPSEDPTTWTPGTVIPAGSLSSASSSGLNTDDDILTEAPTTTPPSNIFTTAPTWTPTTDTSVTGSNANSPEKTEVPTEAPPTTDTSVAGSKENAPEQTEAPKETPATWNPATEAPTEPPTTAPQTEAPSDAPTFSPTTESSETSDSGSDANAILPTNVPTEPPATWTPTTDTPTSISTSGSADETPAPATRVPTTLTPTPEPTPSSPAPVPSEPITTIPTSSSSSSTGSFEAPNSSSSEPVNSSSGSSDDTTFSPPPVTSTPQTQAPTTSPTTEAPSSGSNMSKSETSSDLSSSGSATTPSSSISSSGSSDTTWSPPPVTNAPKTTSSPSTADPVTSSSSSGAAASSGSADSSDTGSDTTASDSSESSDESTPSPAPVTRAPAVTTDESDGGDDVSQTEQISSDEDSLGSSSSSSSTPSPAPVTRSPSAGIMTMPPSAASSDSLGTVIPADTSDIDNSAAEAITKQTDSGSSDDDDQAALNNNNLILLGDTGSKIIYTDGSTVTTFDKFTRGQDLKALENGNGGYGDVVVGGSNRSNLPPGASISLSSSAQEVQNALLYASYALGIVSTVLLVFFHVLALQRPSWLSGSFDTGSQDGGNGRSSMGWLTPNVWELAVVVGYIQHVNSISMLELTKAPQIVLDFTDSFSYANLHLSSVTTTAVSEASRRLQLIILTGIVAFSDRIGMDEDQALMTTFWFFLAIVAVLVILFGVATGFAFYRHRMSAETWSAFWPTALRNSFAMCIVGLGVALWMVCVFPLVSMSSYELVMELQYRVGVGLAVALFSLWAVVVGGLCYAFVSVRAIPINNAFRFKHFAVWGSLYGESKKAFRYFFVVTVGCQILLGVLTGAVSGVPTQLVALMVTHLLFIVVALIIRPFAARWVLGVVVGLRVVAIVNLMCSFAFLTSSELSIHWRAVVAQGFVIFNSIVFFLFFARYVAMFILVLKRWSGYTRRESILNSQQGYDVEQQTGTGSDHNPMFMTFDVRQHRQYNDGGRFIATGGGFAPSRGPQSGYSSGYSSEYSSDRYASTPTYSSGHSGQRLAPTPSGSSGYSSGSRAHGQSRGAPRFYQ
ncbi:unnamed protein product [Phytophthora fragariaefolia]|uniref:Unnamed protein product n=1 Tax=Phytophthora fragariaefolia TaxID=1490495 RepID=A0A9W6XQ05_9STRA|nr:unnamed protein product [Phytophthora fragariaefolia]